MATLSELVETVAATEGMDPATVSLIARSVREAGLITTGGRGPSAAKMNLSDAANLMIAVNATGSARNAPQAVRDYRRLEVPDGEVRIRRLLGDALEQLIEAVALKALPDRFLLSPVPRLIAQEFLKEQISVEFTFFKPRPQALLSICTLDEKAIMWTNPSPEPDTKVFNLVTGIEFKFELARGQNKPHGGKYAGDRRDTTSIGYATIRAVGELLR